MSPRLRRMSRRTAIVTAVSVVLGAVALPALAFWTFSTTRSTSFTAATLGGTSVTVPQYSAGTVIVSWTAVTAPGGNAVDGYYVERVSGSAVAACATSPAALTTALACNDVAPAGEYSYRVTAVFRSWSTPVTSVSTVFVDTTAPGAFTPALSNATGNTFINGSTVYTNPQTGLSGGYTVTAAPADAESGINKVTFPTLAGHTGGGADTSSPYSTTYAWSGPTATATGPQNVVAENKALTTTTGTFTVTPDTAVPTGGAVTAGNSSTGTVAVTSTAFSDALSGMATNNLTRGAGTLANNTCGSFTGSTAVTVSGGNDSATLASGCYQYTLTGTDRVGNQAVTTATAKVDTTPPVFTLANVAGSTNVGTDGTSVYFKNPSGTGSFTLTASDPESGVAGTPTFPSFSGWTVSGSGNTRTYTLTSGATAGATASGSITNGLGATTTQSITTVLQNTAPVAFEVQGSGNGNDEPDSGDAVTLTFSSVVNPGTVLSGWNGASTAVKVKFNNNGSTDNAVVQNTSATNTALGTIGLGADYVKNNGQEYTLDATMSMVTVSGRSVVTVTFTSTSAIAEADDGTHTLTWATTNSVKDWGGNTASTTSKSETAPADADF